MRTYHRRQLSKAYRELGRRGRTFDYMDVMRKIPSTDHSPIERQVWREMQTSKELEMVTPATKHRRAKYRLKPRRRSTRHH